MVIALSLTLGGGTHTGFLADTVLQLASIPLLMLAGSRSLEALAAGGSEADGARLWLMVCASIIVVALVQLVPLPEPIWRNLAAEQAVEILRKGSHPVAGWGQLSIAPYSTWAALTSTYVPLAVFGGTCLLGPRQRLLLCWVIVCLLAFGLALGFAQDAGGPSSPLRLFEETNPNDADGFFANRNHFAASLYCALLLASAPTVTIMHRMEGRAHGIEVLWFALALAFLLAVVAGLALARSRAGVLLTMPAIVGVLTVLALEQTSRPEQGTRKPPRSHRLAWATLAGAVVLALIFGLQRIQSRFESDPLDELRIPYAVTTLHEAWSALPLGSGLGTFVPVYALAEKQSDLYPVFANRAHNDILEALLEGGLLSLAMLAAFLGWYAYIARRIWRAHPHAIEGHAALQRAAYVVVGLLLLHSLVDYPLRTAALSAVFAFCCGVLVRAPHASRHGTHGRPASAQRSGPPPPSPRSHIKWGNGMVWPENWQKLRSVSTDDGAD